LLLCAIIEGLETSKAIAARTSERFDMDAAS
jgi:hypothetical protein